MERNSMVRFSSRNDYKPAAAPRVIDEEAPDRVRVELGELLIEHHESTVEAYRHLRKVLKLRADNEIWSEEWAKGPFEEHLFNMEWFFVYDLFEELAEGLHPSEAGRYAERVNAAFAQAGVVYELRDDFVERLDVAGEEVGVQHSEDEALGSLTNEFAPVLGQYQKALQGLHGRPADFKQAIRESANALEAVARIISGKQKATLGDALNAIYGPGTQDHHKALKQSLANLYGYASGLPGARHGQNINVEVSFDEALLTVRLCGASIAFLIAEYRALES
jgi:hypothetical protein